VLRQFKVTFGSGLVVLRGQEPPGAVTAVPGPACATRGDHTGAELLDLKQHTLPTLEGSNPEGSTLGKAD